MRGKKRDTFMRTRLFIKRRSLAKCLVVTLVNCWEGAAEEWRWASQEMRRKEESRKAPKTRSVIILSEPWGAYFL